MDTRTAQKPGKAPPQYSAGYPTASGGYPPVSGGYSAPSDDGQKAQQPAANSSGVYYVPTPQESPPPPPQRAHHKYRQEETIGDRLLGIIADWVGVVLKPSHTIAKIDLARPYRQKELVVPVAGEEHAPSRTSPSEYYNGRHGSMLSGAYYSRNAAPHPRLEAEEMESEGGWLGPMHGRGARLKLMQIWDFPDEAGRPTLPLGLNFGVGANFDMDRVLLQPKLRLRGRHVALHIFPSPEIELRAEYPVWGSLGVELKFRLPVQSEHALWDSRSGARILVALNHRYGSGVHLATRGLEFDEPVLRIGEHTNLRVAAIVGFPSVIPFEGKPLKIQVQRLGLKTRI